MGCDTEALYCSPWVSIKMRKKQTCLKHCYWEGDFCLLLPEEILTYHPSILLEITQIGLIQIPALRAPHCVTLGKCLNLCFQVLMF